VKRGAHNEPSGGLSEQYSILNITETLDVCSTILAPRS
jgi:hypothetical protein